MVRKPENITLKGDTTKTFTANPPKITKRIGGTTYVVSIHYSQTSRENINDKITRLIKNEALPC